MTLPATALDSPGNPWGFVAWFGCLCGTYIFGQGIHLLRRRGRSGAPTKINAAASGPVFVCGRVGTPVAGAGALTAGVSGKPCTYYRARVWRRQESARGDVWETVAQETLGQAFVIDDGTGRIQVDPKGADLDLPRDSYEEYGKTLLATFTDIPPQLEEFLERNKVDRTSALRVEEYLLAPGAEIFIHGIADMNPAWVESEAAREKKNAAHSRRGKRLEGPPVVAPAQVIRLSPEVESRPATEMTMQSRVAAALALARTGLRESIAPNPLHIPSIAVKAAEEEKERPEVEPAATGVPLPALLVRQKDGYRFSISHRSQPLTESPSIPRALALMVAGPVITFASAYFLLTAFGWL